jgi:hypothetical protein
MNTVSRERKSRKRYCRCQIVLKRSAPNAKAPQTATATASNTLFSCGSSEDWETEPVGPEALVLRKKGASGSAPFEFFLTRIEGTTAESRAGRKWVGGSRCLANAAGGSEESRWFWVITLCCSMPC